MEQDSKHERKAGSTLNEGKSCSCLSSVTLLFLMELLPSRAPLRFIMPCKGNERILLHHQKAPCNLTHRTKPLQKKLQIDLYAKISLIDILLISVMQVIVFDSFRKISNKFHKKVNQKKIKSEVNAIFYACILK